MQITTSPVRYHLEPHLPDENIVIINKYFDNYVMLAQKESWKEIISQGLTALEAARKAHKPSDEAKICAQLTSSAFYLGDYPLALIYAKRCHELSEEFLDPSLFIRALYLESAAHRALAGKQSNAEQAQQTYQQAVAIAEEAAQVYLKAAIAEENLKGKVYFNLGAAYADNPHGDIEKAANCYAIALEAFKNVKATDDIVRTSIRIGKIHLLQKRYEATQEVINEVRPQISNERLAMHTDYLEAQLKLALKDFPKALRIANHGLERARILGAQEDEVRLSSLIATINSFDSQNDGNK